MVILTTPLSGRFDIRWLWLIVTLSLSTKCEVSISTGNDYEDVKGGAKCTEWGPHYGVVWGT